MHTSPSAASAIEPFGPDRAAAAEFLHDRFGPDTELVAELRPGAWSRAYAFRLDGRDLVIRFSDNRRAFDIDSLAMRFASPTLPIPRVSEVGEALGGFFAVSERARGGYLDDLGPADLLATVPSIQETLDGMRLAETSGTSGYGPWDSQGAGTYGSWREYLLDVGADRPGSWSAGWREQLEASPGARAAFEQGYAAFVTLVDRCPESRHLLHSDLLHYNVFVLEHRISALIDWQCAMFGDFLYDLAWFTFWAPWHPPVEAADLRRAVLHGYRAIGLTLPNFDARMRYYEIHIGLRHIVYNLWRRDGSSLDATIRRTLAVAEG